MLPSHSSSSTCSGCYYDKDVTSYVPYRPTNRRLMDVGRLDYMNGGGGCRTVNTATKKGIHPLLLLPLVLL